MSNLSNFGGKNAGFVKSEFQFAINLFRILSSIVRIIMWLIQVRWIATLEGAGCMENSFISEITH
jgi:Mu-like prophage FluMu protein gp28